jgi:hypothetical protein
MTTSIIIRGLLDNWELSMLLATKATNPYEAASLATKELFDATHAALIAETGQFFATVKCVTAFGIPEFCT